MKRETMQVEDIQDIIEQKLMAAGKFELAKKYIIYRYTRELVRKANTTDDSIMSLIQNSNKDVMEENSNKNVDVVSVQRDYLAGEVSRAFTERMLPNDILDAHRQGIIHFHDADYFMVHEHKPYGMDLRDAATGEILLHKTADDDTGRGIMAHFNSESEDAYWQFSADNGLYDTSGKLIASNVTHGGGAGLSFRIYWNGDLADDFYGKNVLEAWNPNSGGFGRMQVNGGNYVIGNYNNSSKQNPCVSGDLLGDWREEIVTWQQSGNDYQLVINATDFQTDYAIPHLMDDPAYRAQLISQNVVYNQPPHLSYDLRSRYTIERQVPESGWDALYTSYPVILPAGITAYSVTGVNAEADTLRMTRLAKGAVVPAGAAVLYRGTAGATVKFVPSAKSAASVNKTYLKGAPVDSVLTSDEAADEIFYTLQPVAETGGVAFVSVSDGSLVEAGTPWLRVKGNAEAPALPQYYVTKESLPTGIQELPTVNNQSQDSPSFDLGGKRVAQPRQGEVYIVNGKKIITSQR
jgi:hypothetical protein